ncbi:MAG: NAD(P)/FAD-dependent oxidoreductase [Cyclobacteriaceae bacterium]
MEEGLDIVIIGAGLSGIGAACHLRRKNPDKKFLILESRSELGGTWSLFKYPGVRSDSDMYTFGYSFKTWNNPKSYADAPSILKYLNEAAQEHEILDRIRYNQRVDEYNFDSSNNLWTVKVSNPETGIETSYTCRFLLSCSGYYSYDQGYTPTFEGSEDFNGAIYHPQKWPEDAQLKDKKVVVIGSGATAVTIVPEIAQEVSHVTMLQRSPTYVGALPNQDKAAQLMKRIFPKGIAYRLIRVKNIMLDMIFFNFCRRFPEMMKNFIIKNAKAKLGDFPVDPHFTPNYNPWEQRFCLAPDGDLFRAIRKGKASVVTDTIDRFVTNGIRLNTGETLEADVIITATGLNILPFGGVKVKIDDKPFDFSESFVYKGLMLSGLPNFFIFVGYTNASWTLKSDLTSEYISRVLNEMDKDGLTKVEAHIPDEGLKKKPLMNLNSGYLHRAAGALPSQGHKAPWKVYQNYILDYKMLRIDSIRDNALSLS